MLFLILQKTVRGTARESIDQSGGGWCWWAIEQGSSSTIGQYHTVCWLPLAAHLRRENMINQTSVTTGTNICPHFNALPTPFSMNERNSIKKAVFKRDLVEC